MKSTTVLKVYRTIIEKPSPDNGEYILYGKVQLELNTKLPEGKVIISRPIWGLEGIVDTQTHLQSITEAQPSELTLALDAIFRLHGQAKFFELLDGLNPNVPTPSKVVANLLGSNLFNCISRKFTPEMYATLIAICENTIIDKSTQVYPMASTPTSACVKYFLQTGKNKLTIEEVLDDPNSPKPTPIIQKALKLIKPLKLIF